MEADNITVSVKVHLHEQNHKFKPKYGSKYAAGADLKARMNKRTILFPGQSKTIPLGIYLDMPQGWEVQLRPRSGLASKRGLTLINGIGTIDSDYTGELKACIINLSEEPQSIEPYDRICQMVVKQVPIVTLDIIDQPIVKRTKRGDKGFGSTGTT